MNWSVLAAALASIIMFGAVLAFLRRQYLRAGMSVCKLRDYLGC